MNYEVISFETMRGTQEHVVITHDDGSCESFPADETNPRYLAFLEETA